jgi:hypothetical protein
MVVAGIFLLWMFDGCFVGVEIHESGVNPPTVFGHGSITNVESGGSQGLFWFVTISPRRSDNGCAVRFGPIENQHTNYKSTVLLH